MIHENVEFHNVSELYEDLDPGLRLLRVPESVRKHLHERAQSRMLAAAATEIRFVMSGDRVTIELSSEEGCELIPFYGRLQGKERIRIPKEPTAIEITLPDRLPTVDEATRSTFHFSQDVWRLTLRGEGSASTRSRGMVSTRRPRTSFPVCDISRMALRSRTERLPRQVT